LLSSTKLYEIKGLFRLKKEKEIKGLLGFLNYHFIRLHF